ncbi:Transmembrane 209 [Chlorella sorokiniana]|uniref:Transmembrane 209 n=1 Tax=Chlorella sorokiniana TaxID=3076 RepID=A0A2P6TDG3_CHLSO|nr:Transmembrane 209 [Chlorella sorokiniana]|eukprot:PRW20681.1 Transmembrane 209 [Chlorella sorokiniana]
MLATLLVAAGVHSLLAKGPAAKAAAPAAAPMPATPKPPTPLGPPLRGGRGLVVGPPAAGAEASPAAVPSSAGRPSPFGARPITTPEQLRRVLDEFEEGTAPSPAQQPAETGYSPAAGVRLGTSSPLLGPAPVYRPSAVPKGKAAVPVATDGKVGPSTLESKRALLERLDMSERSLEHGTERLREWMAARVLKPLVRAIDTAHTNVIDTAARIGWQGVQLQPLESLSAQQRNHADDEVVVAQMREQLLARMRSLGSLQPPAEATACLEAVNAYQRLSALLRGEYPAGLLPPTPQGYVVARIRELAEGSCMAAFEWNKGGEWGGKPWSPELPTDSALVFYLFASYLAAPQWLFSQGDATAISGLSGTLYLGKLPTKPADGYVGVLPSRPPASPKGTSVVGLQLGTQQPLFALIVAGDNIYAASGSTALLQVLLLFLRLCQQELGGALGARHIQHLELARVLKPYRPTFDLVSSAARLIGRYF